MVIKVFYLSILSISSVPGGAQASEFLQKYNHLQPPALADFSMVDIILIWVAYFSTKHKFLLNGISSTVGGTQ